jgi:hypothetical protein
VAKRDKLEEKSSLFCISLYNRTIYENKEVGAAKTGIIYMKNHTWIANYTRRKITG